MRIAVDRCVNCLCRCCSKHYCPYILSRCKICLNNDFRLNIDCDWFENVKIAPKRLKVNYRSSKAKDNINVKLDYIIENMGLVTPYVEKLGTYDVIYKKICLARFDCRSDAELFVKKYQSELREDLKIIKVHINI